MRKLFKKQSPKAGLPPGSLLYVGDKKIEEVKITLVQYNEDKIEKEIVTNLKDCSFDEDMHGVKWLNIDGLHRTDLIDEIGKHFDIHFLVLEDILNTNQRPKMEDYEDYIFITLKMLFFNDVSKDITKEQVSIIMGKNYVISFQEKEYNVFSPVIERLKKSKGPFRCAGPDYLAYVLLDSIIDNYFITLEKVGDQLENLEQELISEPTQHTLEKIYRYKNEILFLSRSIRPLRELIIFLQKSVSPLIDEETDVYLKDLYDHAIRVIDIVESYRDMLTGMMDIYISRVSLKLNEIMKVLTIFASIFIPLTFIVGIYGMNFTYMPELEWKWSYPVLWIMMLSLFFFMLYYFKKKKWL